MDFIEKVLGYVALAFEKVASFGKWVFDKLFGSLVEGERAPVEQSKEEAKVEVVEEVAVKESNGKGKQKSSK